jgi:hypothetical protein
LTTDHKIKGLTPAPSRHWEKMSKKRREEI